MKAGLVSGLLRSLKAYAGRGKALRGEISSAVAFNSTRAQLARRVTEEANNRLSRADILRRFRTLPREVKKWALSGERVPPDVLKELNARYSELLKVRGYDRPGSPYPRALGLGGVGSEAGTIGSSDMIAPRGLLRPLTSLPGDSAGFNKLKARLSVMGPEKDVAALRRQLRRYYLTNAGMGAVGALGLGGVGYGTYTAVSGSGHKGG